MPPDPKHRDRYRQFLIDHDLPAEVADAILETMPPFDWSEIARNSELEAMRRQTSERFTGVDLRLERLEHATSRLAEEFRDFRQEMRDFRSEFHSMSRTVMFAILALVLTLTIAVYTVASNGTA